MPNVHVEPRPKGRTEGSPIEDDVALEAVFRERYGELDAADLELLEKLELEAQRVRESEGASPFDHVGAINEDTG